MLKPNLLLRLEGAAVLVAAVSAYAQLHGSWGWFALLFLAPDIFLLGYAANLQAGARLYNLGHTYVVPLLVLGILKVTGGGQWYWLAVIWLAHIGFDRLAGYGLKYETAFKETHLQRV